MSQYYYYYYYYYHDYYDYYYYYYYYHYYSSVITSYTISTAVRGRARGERARGELTEGGEAVWPASCTYPPYCPGGG